MDFDEMVLPVSGLCVEWRAADEHFRIRPSHTDSEGEAAPPWRTWLGHNDMAVGAAGPIPEEPEEMWWAVWGEYTGADVQVTLDDQSRPHVLVFGNLWIAEWRGPEQEATVVTADRQAEIHFAHPISLQERTQRMRHNRLRGPSHIETPAGFHEMSIRPDRRNSRLRSR
ncbi:hypothetical protein ACFVUS_06180 [Nocardia sp. NPDC058058]|uniref:hypothetical protein n=1 Tax=Nocardia sp. NPDC058058 TaxID=3346317 RepID=UPI0036D92FEB